MARYITEVVLDKPIDVVSMVMEDYTYHEKYIRADWNGEMVFMKEESYGGNRYLMWYYAAGMLHMEAWKKGAFGREANPGPAVITELNGLVYKIRKQDESKVAGGHVGSDPLHHDSDHQDNHTTWKQDTAWQGSQTVNRTSNYTTTTNRTVNPQANALAAPFVTLVMAFSFMAFAPIVSIILCSITKGICRKGKTAGFALCSFLASVVRMIAIIMMFVKMVPFFANGFGTMIMDVLKNMLESM